VKRFWLHQATIDAILDEALVCDPRLPSIQAGAIREVTVDFGLERFAAEPRRVRRKTD
jgi:hypothetical protein